MAWSKLGSTTLTTSGDSIVVDSMTEKKFVFFMTHCIESGNTGGLQRLNNDSGSNYASRFSDNGGTDSAFTTQSYLYSDWNPTVARDIFMIGYIINIATEEKLLITQTVKEQTSGAGTAPFRQEHVGKWSNTSDAMTELRMHNIESGDFATDSNLSIIGTD